MDKQEYIQVTISCKGEVMSSYVEPEIDAADIVGSIPLGWVASFEKVMLTEDEYESLPSA